METASSYIKQYGLKSSLKRAFLRILNPIIAVKVDIVLAISSHKTNSNLNKEVKVINMSNLQYWRNNSCLLYTSDAADDLLCVDLGGRRIIKKKKY